MTQKLKSSADSSTEEITIDNKYPLDTPEWVEELISYRITKNNAVFLLHGPGVNDYFMTSNDDNKLVKGSLYSYLMLHLANHLMSLHKFKAEKEVLKFAFDPIRGTRVLEKKLSPELEKQLEVSLADSDVSAANAALAGIGASVQENRIFTKNPDTFISNLSSWMMESSEITIPILGLMQSIELFLAAKDWNTNIVANRIVNNLIKNIALFSHITERNLLHTLLLISEYDLDVLHPALRDENNGIKQIYIPLPDLSNRIAMINKLKETPSISKDMNLSEKEVELVGKNSAGCSLRELKHLVLNSIYEKTSIPENITKHRKRYVEKFGNGLVTIDTPINDWSSVGGLDYVKNIMDNEVIPFLKIQSPLTPSGLLFTGPPGCHRKGQGILMSDGLIKKVEDIVPGDRLMGGDGKSFRTVLSLCRGREKMVQVTPNKGTSFVVNENHILTLVRTTYDNHVGGELIDISIKELEKLSKNRRHHLKLIRSEAIFEGALSEEEMLLDPYFLGVLLGDGSFKYGGVGVTTCDEEIVEEIKNQALKFGLNIRINDSNAKAPTYYLHGKSGKLTTRDVNLVICGLKLLGLYRLGCGEKFVPFSYKTATYEARLKILAGLIDTDGSLGWSATIDFISKSEQLANDVVFLARSVGLAAYIKKCRKCCQNNFEGEYFRVGISGDIDKIPVKIRRKKALPRKQKKSVLRTGFSVVDVGEEEYFGFTLDGDGRYLLDDFTVTHNTGKSVTAEAIAYSCGLPFLTLNISQVFHWYVGSSEANIKKVTEIIKAVAPCIVFMDEVDQMGMQRGGYQGDSGVSARIFKKLLEFLGDDNNRGQVVFIAATNKPKLIDSAMRRTGRIDFKIPFVLRGNEPRASIIDALLCKYKNVINDVGVEVEVNSLEVSPHLRELVGSDIECLIKDCIRKSSITTKKLTTTQMIETSKFTKPSVSKKDIVEATKEALEECNVFQYLPQDVIDKANIK
jgi:SpoVK/Ycf46/Vps4 family AAA+-type ATPase